MFVDAYRLKGKGKGTLRAGHAPRRAPLPPWLIKRPGSFPLGDVEEEGAHAKD